VLQRGHYRSGSVLIAAGGSVYGQYCLGVQRGSQLPTLSGATVLTVPHAVTSVINTVRMIAFIVYI
jgi:hypothetical protein